MMKSSLLLVGGALLGFLAIGGARYAALEPVHHVHYHANWAIFVNGSRLPLTDEQYMEDVFQCMADPSHQEPEHRVHMHEGNQDVVHVHDAGVTWGHLLANLGFGVGDDYLHTDGMRLESGEAGTLKFILNGSQVATIRNSSIGDQDRLLISFGPESVQEAIATQFPQVADNAGQYNEMPDPASCSGNIVETPADRLRRAFWF